MVSGTTSTTASNLQSLICEFDIVGARQSPFMTNSNLARNGYIKNNAPPDRARLNLWGGNIAIITSRVLRGIYIAGCVARSPLYPFLSGASFGGI